MMNSATPYKKLLAFLLVLASAPAGAATTCVIDRLPPSIDASTSAGQRMPPCALHEAAELFASMRDAVAAADEGGTRVYQGSVFSNISMPSLLSRSLALDTSGSLLTQADAPVMSWEILGTEPTLQKTFARWAVSSGWDVIWLDVPEISNPGQAKVPAKDFLEAVDFVFARVQTAAKAAGLNLQATAYPNRVLVISKDDRKK
jgi:Toxin co-regulated pilus biosynthesis protein Q